MEMALVGGGGGRPHRPWWTHTWGRWSFLSLRTEAGRWGRGKEGREAPPHARPRGQLSPPWGGDAILFSLRREAPTSRAGGGGSTWNAPPESRAPGPRMCAPPDRIPAKGPCCPVSLAKSPEGQAPRTWGRSSLPAGGGLRSGLEHQSLWVPEAEPSHPTSTKPGVLKRVGEGAQSWCRERSSPGEAAGEAAVV